MPSVRQLSDDQLLSQCRFEVFRGPGPGGQKKNKTSSAVRLTHEPSGISVIAGESRSQYCNRGKAIERLRHRLAIEMREPVEVDRFPDPELVEISKRSERYPKAIGTVLDVLASKGWSVSESAELLGITTGRLVSFLQDDEKLWTHVNQQRQKSNLRPLR